MLQDFADEIVSALDKDAPPFERLPPGFQHRLERFARQVLEPIRVDGIGSSHGFGQQHDHLHNGEQQNEIQWQPRAGAPLQRGSQLNVM